MITIILPCSREEYLDKIFSCLEFLECDRSQVNLLTIVDGDASLYVKVRNFTEMSKFANRLCVQYKNERHIRKFDVLGRRYRIAEIHNLAREHIWDSDYILGIEDDTIFPTNTLTKLIRDYSEYPYAGMIQGVELGRWGIAHVGAWNTDDVYNPEVFETLLPPKTETIEPIDAGGFYCFITKAEHYLSHDFQPFQAILGPDVNYCLELRKQGLQNYIDWSLNCTHKRPKGDLNLQNTTPLQFSLHLNNNRWVQHIDVNLDV